MKKQEEIVGKYIPSKDPTGQLLSHRIVWLCKTLGIIPTLKHKLLTCVDCECPAEHYEHRDYNHPLRIVVVCPDCNEERGGAKPAGLARRGILIKAMKVLEKASDNRPTWKDYKSKKRGSKPLHRMKSEREPIRQALHVIGVEVTLG